MSCYLHQNAEGVVTCGKCGVTMCRECESKAFFRTDNGKGHALCNRCSLVEAQEIVDFESSWLKRRLIKLIFCTAFVLWGLIMFLSLNSSGDVGSGIFYAVILWAISGAIANIGNKRNGGSVKNQIWNAAYEYNHPIMNMIISIVINALFGPILLIAHIVGYLRTKLSYKRDLEILETLKSQV